MRPEQLKGLIKKRSIGKVDKAWFHYDEDQKPEFQRLFRAAWPKFEMQELAATGPGVTQICGQITFKVTDHYFRSLAKIGFHYYLVHSRRGFRGEEDFFAPIREFIMNGGDKDSFFRQSGPTFVMPYGKLPSGGVMTPKQWCHVLAADETEKAATVYVQMFVGRGCVPQPYNIMLATIDSRIFVLKSTWGHVYLYDDPPGSDRYAGRVEEAQITGLPTL